MALSAMNKTSRTRREILKIEKSIPRGAVDPVGGAVVQRSSATCFAREVLKIRFVGDKRNFYVSTVIIKTPVQPKLIMHEAIVK